MLLPMLSELMSQLQSVGGLPGMFENSLYTKRLYTDPYVAPMIGNDATTTPGISSPLPR